MPPERVWPGAGRCSAGSPDCTAPLEVPRAKLSCSSSKRSSHVPLVLAAPGPDGTLGELKHQLRWRSRTGVLSCVASSCSRPNSRIVSSIPKRGSPPISPRRRTRLRATSCSSSSRGDGARDQRRSGSPFLDTSSLSLSSHRSQTASAAPSGEAADEDRERPEGTLLVWIEQVVAPGDRVAQGPLTGWQHRAGRRSGAGGDGRAVSQRSGSSTRVRAAASSSASGRPSSRAQIVATAARVRRGKCEVGANSLRPLHEQRDGTDAGASASSGGR